MKDGAPDSAWGGRAPSEGRNPPDVGVLGTASRAADEARRAAAGLCGRAMRVGAIPLPYIPRTRYT